MLCLRCGNNLIRKQKKYCSIRCSRNAGREIYRKKHREKVNEYNRNYRKRNKGGWAVVYEYAEGKCYFCGTKDKLQQHHIDYINNKVVDLCELDHKKFHALVKKQKTTVRN